ncbi:hypothetical protein ACP4OV_025403 [Aristida adscensionis]
MLTTILLVTRMIPSPTGCPNSGSLSVSDRSSRSIKVLRHPRENLVALRRSVGASPSSCVTCLAPAAMDESSQESGTISGGADVTDAADETIVYAPPASYPACFRQVEEWPGTISGGADVVDAAGAAFVYAPPACFRQVEEWTGTVSGGADLIDAAGAAFVYAPPACFRQVEEWTGTISGGADVIDAAGAAFVYEPPASDPAGFRQADATPYREHFEEFVDAARAARGLPAASAAMFRRRRAMDHQARAAECAERRRHGLGAHNDALCRGVQAALDTGVAGSCAYCGADFAVVAVVDVVGVVDVEEGKRTVKSCGVCGRQVRRPAPARKVAADAEERWKGWLPW